MEFLKGYKTVIFNILAIIFGAIEAGDFTNIIPDSYEGFVLSIVGIINIWLRANTNTPIGRSR